MSDFKENLRMSDWSVYLKILAQASALVTSKPEFFVSSQDDDTNDSNKNFKVGPREAKFAGIRSEAASALSLHCPDLPAGPGFGSSFRKWPPKLFFIQPRGPVGSGVSIL